MNTDYKSDDTATYTGQDMASTGQDMATSRTEGRLAKTIEDQTAKLPSDTFLWMAVGAMTVSASLQMMGNRHASLFVGQWAPTFLIFGLYNKLVKQLGSDQMEREGGSSFSTGSGMGGSSLSGATGY
jgi:hypothetical protein